MELVLISFVIITALTGMIGCMCALLRYRHIYYPDWKTISLYIILYFASSFFNWLNMLFSICFRDYLLITNTIWCFTVMVNPVFLFRIIDNMTRRKYSVGRRLLSYGLPIGGIVAIFIILLSRPASYGGVALLFLPENNPVVILISGIGSYYMLINLYMLRKYRKKQQEENTLSDADNVLTGIFTGICIILLIMSPVWFVYFSSGWIFLIITGLLMLAFSFFHILLATRIIEIEKKPVEELSELYSPEKQSHIPEKNPDAITLILPEPPAGSLSLDKRSFNKWIKSHKPFLNPELKIEELACMYGVSVRELSGFMNREYGLNFNQYINRCRLAEFQQLKAKNKKARLAELVARAGFGSMASCNRAKIWMDKKTEV
ncbi:MAG: hypothetical protein LUG18_09290 [Candidatus Azobacteroides sp.]|nr:hypothetical protein [Candidatus Azobacteroides sp.]